MKKLFALLCILITLCTCVACSNNGDTDPTFDMRDPQQENALPVEDLTRFAESTGALTNYRIAIGYTSTSENIVTIIMHDGKNEQQRKIFYNTVNPDGTTTMNRLEQFRLVWSEKAKYTMNDGEEQKTKYSFDKVANETKFADAVNEMVCPGFYDAIVEKMSTATYNIIKDQYNLETLELTHNGETFMFEDVCIQVDNRYVTAIYCNNGAQSINIELTGINDVNFGGNN